MMSKLNYRQGLTQPQFIQKLSDEYSLPVAVRLADIGLYLLVVLLEFACVGHWIGWLIRHFSIGGYFVVFVVVPYLVLLLIWQLKPDGKNLFLFAYDYCLYFKRYVLNKKKVSNGKRLVVYDTLVYRKPKE